MISDVLFFFFEIFMIVLEEFLARHWNIRKTYQTSLYRFNAYHEMNLLCWEYFDFNFELDFRRLYTYTYIYYAKPFKMYAHIMYYLIISHWYFHWWMSWIILTVHLYFHPEVRDLGQAYDVYEYNPDIVVNPYRTIGPFLLFSWSIWTVVANTVFLESIFYYLNRFFWLKYTWAYWYFMTI